MILVPERYLNREEEGDGPLLDNLKRYIAYRLFDTPLAIPRIGLFPTDDNFDSLPDVAKAAIQGAAFLVGHFKLDLCGLVYLVEKNKPWYDPGLPLTLTDEARREMGNAMAVLY